MVMDQGTTDAGAVREASSSAPGGQAVIGESIPEPRRLRTASTQPLALEYVSVSDEQTLEELDTIDCPALILLAARAGATRLIDNTIVVPKARTRARRLAPLHRNQMPLLCLRPECLAI